MSFVPCEPRVAFLTHKHRWEIVRIRRVQQSLGWNVVSVARPSIVVSFAGNAGLPAALIALIVEFFHCRTSLTMSAKVPLLNGHGSLY